MQRFKDPVVQELPERLAGNLRDNQPQHYVRGIAVSPMRPWRKLTCGLPLQQSQDFLVLNLMRGGPCIGFHQVFVVRQSRRVRQQMAHSDGLPVRREIRQDFGQPPVVPQLVIVDQQHDGHGRKLFGEGCQAKVRFGIDGGQCSQIANPIASLEYGAAIPAHQHRHSRRFRIGQRREDGIDVRGRSSACTHGQSRQQSA